MRRKWNTWVQRERLCKGPRGFCSTGGRVLYCNQQMYVGPLLLWVSPILARASCINACIALRWVPVRTVTAQAWRGSGTLVGLYSRSTAEPVATQAVVAGLRVWGLRC